MTLKELVWEGLRQKNMSLTELSKEINVSPSNFSTSIKKHRPKAETLLKISRLLDIDLTELIETPLE